jgi:hypothetical protein
MAPGTPPSAAVLVIGATAWVFAAGVFWLRVLRTPPTDRFLRAAFASFALVAVAFAFAVGPRHDYQEFLLQWDGILAGVDPWDREAIGSMNAYGPLYVALAPLSLLHDLAPKLLFTAAWIVAALWLFRLYEARPDTRRHAPLVLGYFVLTPYFWVEIALYGHFDILPALGTLLALHLVLRRRTGAGGAMLGLAALLKIAPLVALPFLVATLRNGRARLVGGCAAIVAVGMTAAYLLWGRSVFEPLTLGADRESNLLSIFHFLRRDYSPLRLVVDEPNVDGLSTGVVLLALSILMVAAVARRMRPVVAVMSAFVVLFALYTLGHPQFQMIVFLLVPYLYLTLPESVRTRRSLVVPVAAYLVWYSAFDVVYVVGGWLVEWPWVFLAQTLGLPTFLIALACLLGLVSAGRAPLGAPAELEHRSAPS